MFFHEADQDGPFMSGKKSSPWSGLSVLLQIFGKLAQWSGTAKWSKYCDNRFIFAINWRML